MNKRTEKLIYTKNLINSVLKYSGFLLYLYSCLYCFVHGYLPVIKSTVNPYIWMIVIAPTALTMFIFFLQLLSKSIFGLILMAFISKKEMRYILVSNS
jgi:hypothetical protein